MPTSTQLLWADLHNHNEIGYGEGSLERSYRIAENTLDVYALSIHGHWPDPPADDRELADSHRRAFARTMQAFPEVVRQANSHYRPGRLVCFAAYEWHSSEWGDYVVIFPGDSADLHPAATLQELQSFVRRRGALMIPHHVGYRLGWRGLDWRQVDYSLSPVAEVFSEHGGCWERDDLWPMLAHSMGGITRSQTILAQLEAGAHFGFTAGTDTHFGYPASYGEGITGIFAGEKTRESVFAALRGRRTLAATGDRIGLWAESDGALPGDVLPSGAAHRIRVRVDPLAPLDYVEVIKNGVRAHLWPGPRRTGSGPAKPATYLCRLEWGWGRMTEADETDWIIRLQVDGGEIRRVVPCLGGGAPAVKKLNLIRFINGRSVEVDSFTSRRNALPVNGVVLEIAGDAGTKIGCEVEATVEGKPARCRLGATLADLLGDDVWSAILPRFSSPKIRLGRACAASDLVFAAEYRDDAPGSRDTYVVKARQTNGHTAWASPFLFAD